MADGAHIIDAGQMADFNRTTREIVDAPRGRPLVVQANSGFFNELERHVAGIMGSLPHNIRNAIDRARRGEALSGVTQDAFVTASRAANGDTAAIAVLAGASGGDYAEARADNHEERQREAQQQAARHRLGRGILRDGLLERIEQNGLQTPEQFDDATIEMLNNERRDANKPPLTQQEMDEVRRNNRRLEEAFGDRFRHLPPHTQLYLARRVANEGVENVVNNPTTRRNVERAIDGDDSGLEQEADARGDQNGGDLVRGGSRHRRERGQQRPTENRGRNNNRVRVQDSGRAGTDAAIAGFTGPTRPNPLTDGRTRRERPPASAATTPAPESTTTSPALASDTTAYKRTAQSTEDMAERVIDRVDATYERFGGEVNEQMAYSAAERTMTGELENEAYISEFQEDRALEVQRMKQENRERLERERMEELIARQKRNNGRR